MAKTDFLGWNRAGLALSGLMLAVLPACGTTPPMASAGGLAPTGASQAKAAKAEAKKAVLLASSAQAAIQRADGVAAVRDAEAVVMLAPNDAATRALLGRAYLAAGRFQSANSAFGDALTLDPNMGKVAVTRALTQIALGDKDGALISLGQARGLGDEAEIGLAFALAGEKDEATLRLEAAVRASGANARVRQNLALVYALQGRWDDAAATAAVDVPAEQMTARMQRWSQVVQRSAQPGVQVAMLLGILPSADSGLPEALALTKAEAAAPIAVVDVPAAEREIAVVAVPAIPQAHAIVSATPPTRYAAMKAAVFAQPERLLAVVPAKPEAQKAAKATIIRAGITQMGGRISVKPRPTLLAKRTAPVSVPRSRTGGNFAVQLGAFSSARRTEAAWNHLSGKARYLSGFTPMGSGHRQGGATLYRLSISGLQTRADAARLCGRIKSGGGDCFVRIVANDRPMRWTMRSRDGDAA